MKVSWFVAACSSALMLLGVAGCSDDKSDDSSDGGQVNTNPFAFLAGKYGVGFSPRFANCNGEVYFPQEMWVLSTFFTTVTVMTIPDTSISQQPVTPTEGQGDAGGDTASEGTGSSGSRTASPAQTIPPTFRADMDSTLQWRSSSEEQSVTERGCLARRSTVLSLQFTSDNKVTGDRSIFNEYAGGADCIASCRVSFGVEGARLAGQ